MSRGNASGYVLKQTDAPIIMGMVVRGDREHDIAAWFGVNQGRITDVKDGTKFGMVAAAPSAQLPPKGPPGIKGRRLRKNAQEALNALNADDLNKVRAALEDGIAKYDQLER